MDQVDRGEWEDSPPVSPFTPPACSPAISAVALSRSGGHPSPSSSGWRLLEPQDLQGPLSPSQKPKSGSPAAARPRRSRVPSYFSSEEELSSPASDSGTTSPIESSSGRRRTTQTGSVAGSGRRPPRPSSPASAPSSPRPIESARVPRPGAPSAHRVCASRGFVMLDPQNAPSVDHFEGFSFDGSDENAGGDDHHRDIPSSAHGAPPTAVGSSSTSTSSSRRRNGARHLFIGGPGSGSDRDRQLTGTDHERRTRPPGQGTGPPEAVVRALSDDPDTRRALAAAGSSSVCSANAEQACHGATGTPSRPRRDFRSKYLSSVNVAVEEIARRNQDSGAQGLEPFFLPGFGGGLGRAPARTSDDPHAHAHAGAEDGDSLRSRPAQMNAQPGPADHEAARSNARARATARVVASDSDDSENSGVFVME